MSDNWNYDVENVFGNDARKLVTLTQGGMIWVGIRAYDQKNKSWLNNNKPSSLERIIAWQDIPQPADPRIFAIPKEMTEDFERAMREEVIPEIEADIERRFEAAQKNKGILWK